MIENEERQSQALTTFGNDLPRPLFRDRVTGLSTAMGVDGSSWQLCAKLRHFGMVEDHALQLEYKKFQYEFFVICKAQNLHIDITEPISPTAMSFLTKYGRDLQEQIAAARYAQSGVREPIRFRIIHDPDLTIDQANILALTSAGGMDLLAQLQASASRALVYMRTRRAYTALQRRYAPGAFSSYRDSEATLKALPAQLETERITALSWLKATLEVLAYPNRAVSDLALSLLLSPDQSLNQPLAPPVQPIIEAAVVALG